jgi:hypothetical protein
MQYSKLGRFYDISQPNRNVARYQQFWPCGAPAQKIYSSLCSDSHFDKSGEASAGDDREQIGR